MNKIKFLLILLFFSSCDPFNTNFEEVEDAISYNANSIETILPKDTIKVMTWNVKFGGGRIDFFFDCYGNRVIMTKSEVISNMANLTKIINDVNPDILFTQEIDISSKRTAYVDQVQYILNNTKLNYGRYVSQWKSDFVPSDGIGKVNSGNAIFSKWKFINAKRIALPLISEQDDITQYFYLKRAILNSSIKIGNDTVSVATIHTSAFSHDGTKEKQINIFTDLLKKFKSENKTFIAGGDLNALAPNAEKWENFPDSKCEKEEYQADDYSMEKTLLVELFNNFSPAIPIDSIKKNQSKYFTHTTNKDGYWNRKLDYIFTNKNRVVAGSGVVLQNKNKNTGLNMMDISDHAPIVVEVKIK